MMWRHHGAAFRMHDSYGGWWVALLMLILLAVAMAVLLAIVFRSTGPARRSSVDGHSEGLEILRRRYASGEIDDEEFQRRVAILGQTVGDPARPQHPTERG
jgi:putative membrane protein